jgi:signal transduction histidine kinase
MNQLTPSLAALCQALIAHETCATVVLDPAGRVLAWNTAAVVSFPLDDASRVPDLTAREAAIRDAVEKVGAEGGPQSMRAKCAGGAEVSVAPLRIEGRLAGFVVRAPEPTGADRIAAELDVTRAELAATRDELQTSTLEIASTNVALRAANETLQRRVEELEAAAAAERHKDEFLAMLAHELRTPLAPILSAVQILRRQAADNPMVQRAREVVERQALAPGSSARRPARRLADHARKDRAAAAQGQHRRRGDGGPGGHPQPHPGEGPEHRSHGAG